ncbi:MAG: hypothetical protein RIA62_09600 [Cyclobacteriaceae bacterium]
MKKIPLIILAITITGISFGQPNKPIDINWLQGDQPKLLSMMARSVSTLEEINGTSLSLTTLLGGWHAQAIGQYKDYVYVAFSDGKLLDARTIATKKEQSQAYGKLWVYNIKTNEGKLIDLEKGYEHPCSIQVTGKYLTLALEAAYGTNQMVGIERAQASLIQIFDLEKDPFCSVEVSRITQNEMNCGGAGLTYSTQNKCWYLLADQDFSNSRVALYRTENENLTTWRKEPIAYYPRFGAGAGLNLITATDQSIWGFYYNTNDEGMPSVMNLMLVGNEVKMFKLVEADGTPVAKREVITQIVSIGAPLLKSAGELLANRPGMRFGAGIRIEDDKLELLMCQRNMANNFKIERVKLDEVERTQVMFVNYVKARGEFNVSSQTNASQSNKVQKVQTESWTGWLQSSIKVDINYMPVSTKSISSLSMPKWTDIYDGTTKAPLALFYLDGEPVKGQMKEFHATKMVDNKK